MLVWVVFITVATINLILGIAVAVWMKRGIAGHQSDDLSNNLELFSGIIPSPPSTTVSQQSTNSDDEAADRDAPPNDSISPDITASDSATYAESAAANSTTEAFVVDRLGSTQESDSSESPVNVNSAEIASDKTRMPESEDQGPVEPASEESPPQSGPQEDDVPSETDAEAAVEAPSSEEGEIPGLSRLLELCSKKVHELIDIFEWMRSQPPTKGEELNTILARVRPIMASFFDEYGQIVPRLVSTEQGGPIPEETLACLEEHALAAEQTVQRLTMLDYRGHLQATLQQALAEFGRLIARLQRTRDELEAAFAQGLINFQPHKEVDEKIQRDALTGLFNRTGVEVFFEKHWGGEPHKRKPLWAAILDLDQFRQINQEHGYSLGDELLKAVAQLLAEVVPQGAFLARYRGDQFLVVRTDCESKRFIHTIEEVRQSVEVTKFRYAGETFSLTVSCGVTESRTDDVLTSFCERLDEALLEAKRAGGNRTFIHNGEFAQPIIPLNLKVAEREVSVATVG